MDCPIDVTAEGIFYRSSGLSDIVIYPTRADCEIFVAESMSRDLDKWEESVERVAKLTLIDDLAQYLTQVNIPDLEARKLIALVKDSVC